MRTEPTFTLRLRVSPHDRRVAPTTWRCVLAFATLIGVSATCYGQTTWLTGLKFRQALEAPADYATEKPLRAALASLAEAHRTAVLLDRRVDPGQGQRFTLRGASLREVFTQLARRNEASMCVVGSVVYIGPPETVDVLATVVEIRREEVRKFTSSQRAKLLRTAAMSWPRLSTPRELIEQLEEETKLRVVGKENVPHDLWPEGSLPPLDVAQRLSLLLAGFHVSFEWAADGSAVRLTKMPDKPELIRRYPAGRSAATLARQLQARYPDATVTAVGSNIQVAGLWEVHDAVERLLNGESVRSPQPETGGQKTYTLTVANKPVGSLMKALSQQLGRPVEFDTNDPLVVRRLSQNASVSVKEASLDELLKAVLEPVSLKYELRGETIFVTK